MNHSGFCFRIALVTALLTLGTFVLAFLTPPLSGPFCRAGCFEYPFADIASRFPRDYYWMYPTMLISVLFVILVICIHHFSAERKKLFSQMGFAFAIISAAVMIPNYFTQVSVVQPSLLNGETEGIALLSQFNSHGLFIALEEIGFLLMTFTLFVVTPVFSGKGRLLTSIRITLLTGFPLALIVFLLVTLKFGVMREYYFEVAVISIAWLQLIVASALLSVLFFRLKKGSI